MKKNTFEAPQLSVADLSKSLYETSLKLQEANQKLLQKEQERMEFYANISHDLRAPITALHNSIEYLQSLSNPSAETLKDTLSIMNKRVDYMTVMINDIFLLSSLESSDRKLNKEPVDFRFFIEEFFYDYESDPFFEHCILHLDLSESFLQKCPTLFIDPHLMQRALDNMMRNSVKYCDTTPEITLAVDYQKDDTCIVSIRDNGIGIPAEHIPHIFEHSYRVDRARTPGDTTSSGFGLSIVDRIIKRHSGTLTCESIVGRGTTFTAVLPGILSD